MPAWTCPLSHCCFFFTSISGAVVFPKGLAGAAVIGAFVLLQVTVPWPVTRTFLLYVHRIYNELIKCTCNTSFAACYFETELCQYCLVIGTWPLLLFLVLTGSLKYNPKCVKWLCVCVYPTRQWCFSLRAFHTYDALLSLAAITVKICQNLLGGSGDKVIEIKDGSDKCSFSVKARQKQLSRDKRVRLTLCLKYCKWQRQNCHYRRACWRPFECPVQEPLSH